MRHGTRSTYTYRKCRCAECREANRLYIEQIRRAAGVQPLRRGPQTEHGTWTRYMRHGCRCVECRAANAAAARRYRAKAAK